MRFEDSWDVRYGKNECPQVAGFIAHMAFAKALNLVKKGAKKDVTARHTEIC